RLARRRLEALYVLCQHLF
ncbi:hypothetical protein D021_2337B, partial [Vibrio parahaemolyticus 10296]